MSTSDKFWDSKAEGYANSPISDEASYQRKLSETQAVFTPQMRVLEFGCGTGYFTVAVAEKSKSVLATDLSDSLLEAAKNRLRDHPEVTVQKENCLGTSLAPESCDSVFMANLIHVVENPTKALEESSRILRSGGRIVIVTFTGYGMSLWEKIYSNGR